MTERSRGQLFLRQAICCQISFRNMQPGQPEHHGFIRAGLMGEESIVNHEINAQTESRSSVTMIRNVSLNRTQFVY